MPSPAINTFESLIIPGRFTTIRSWAPEPVVTTLKRVTRTQANQKPATVVNKPIGPAKRRPMSPWSNRWFRCVQRLENFEVKHTIGTSITRQIFENVGPLDLPSQHLNIGDRWGNAASLIPFSPTMEFMADGAARTAVLNKLSQKKWDIGVSALELKQTAGLVTDLATSMVKTIRDLINLRRNSAAKVDAFFRQVVKHGSFDKAAAAVGLTDIGLLNALKDAWMQYQFGVKPAYADLANATTYLSERVLAGTGPLIVYAKAGHTSKENQVRSLLNVNAYIKSQANVTEECQVHYAVQYEIPTGQVRDITSLGLDNPGAIAWEATQLSWMFDYIVDTGGWINSFTATNGMVFREGCCSRLRRVVTSECHSSRGFAANGTLELVKAPNHKGFFLERGDFTRTLLASGVTPAVVPSPRGSLGLVQMANSLFALSDVFSGRRIYR